jgi:hypothetical protein
MTHLFNTNVDSPFTISVVNDVSITSFNPKYNALGIECYLVTLYDPTQNADLDLTNHVNILPNHCYQCKEELDNISFKIITNLFEYFNHDCHMKMFIDPKKHYKIFRCQTDTFIDLNLRYYECSRKTIYVYEEIDQGALFNHIRHKMTRNNLGELESYNDEPALIQHDNSCKNICKNYWYKSGQLHREGNLPAEIHYCIWPYEVPHINSEFWYINGNPSREDKTLPTSIYYSCPRFRRDKLYPSQISCKEFETKDNTFKYIRRIYYEYSIYNKLLRETHSLTKTKIEDHLDCNTYFDREHGDELPAEIIYYSNGQLQKQIWYKDGKIHRVNKPAVIYYNKAGEIEYQKYFDHGKCIVS